MTEYDPSALQQFATQMEARAEAKVRNWTAFLLISGALILIQLGPIGMLVGGVLGGTLGHAFGQSHAEQIRERALMMRWLLRIEENTRRT